MGIPISYIGVGVVRSFCSTSTPQGEIMNYEEKMERIARHLDEHPNDYQSVISLVKVNSDAIADRRRRRANEKKRLVAEIRAERRAKHEKSAQ